MLKTTPGKDVSWAVNTENVKSTVTQNTQLGFRHVLPKQPCQWINCTGAVGQLWAILGVCIFIKVSIFSWGIPSYCKFPKWKWQSSYRMKWIPMVQMCNYAGFICLFYQHWSTQHAALLGHSFPMKCRKRFAHDIIDPGATHAGLAFMMSQIQTASDRHKMAALMDVS